MLINFNETKKSINNIISLSGGMPLTQIYEHTLDMLKNHYLVKAFLLNEGFTNTEIARAKNNLKSRGIK